MEKLIFAYFTNCSDPKDLILTASIRKFGGSLSNNPIWVLIPKLGKNTNKEIKDLFLSLKVEIIPFSTKNEPQFPFINYVLAAANAESLVMNLNISF
ncbi:MAG: hypothetical protein P8Y23_00080 [Candidatus Lokiarchaeota archaeon]